MAKIRINTSRESDRWQLECTECGSKNWRANDGTFQCIKCGTIKSEITDAKNGEIVDREDVEFVGPHANWKAKYASGKNRGD